MPAASNQELNRNASMSQHGCSAAKACRTLLTLAEQSVVLAGRSSPLFNLTRKIPDMLGIVKRAIVPRLCKVFVGF